MEARSLGADPPLRVRGGNLRPRLLVALGSLALLSLSGSLITTAANARRARAESAEAPAAEPVQRASEESPAEVSGTALYGYQPLTPWRRPPVSLPEPRILDYAALAAQGLQQAGRWGGRGWYCEYLGCTGGPFPLATLWAVVPMFETVDALQTAQPSPAHEALVSHFARESERYWDRGLGGYAPYPGDREGDVEAWFDDNGWMGLAFLNAYRATRDSRWLHDARRAFHFIAANGWDASAGGGMWWNTHHPYHSGPALAADALLGTLLYNEDRDPEQLHDVLTWINWANVRDDHDERRLYLEKPNQPESINDYVQAPLIYAQYLLCKDGQGQRFCVRAGRVAATMAERNAIKTGYRDNYGPEYDAIYLQWMMAYGQATAQSYWLKAAELNGAAAAEHAADAQGLWLSSWWGGRIPDPETFPGMFRTMAATTSLFAWLDVYTGSTG
jgi:Glycosyl hydrolase family 76